jgi:hypothetical protein
VVGEFHPVIVMQTRTFRDGTVWLRWLEETDHARPVAHDVPRSSAPRNCAFCCADELHWSRVRDAIDLPKVDLIYECEACGRTTYQGRLAANAERY